MSIPSNKDCVHRSKVCLFIFTYWACQAWIEINLNVSSAKAAETSSLVSIKKRNQKLILAHYMPWYVTEPSWGMHWTGPQKQHNPDTTTSDGLPDIWSHFHPLIGLYDSSDPDVIECHLLQMKLAGIDGVIVDWYGISNAADYPKSHKATKKIFAGAKRLDMKFAICFEDRTIKYLVEKQKLSPDEIQEHLTMTFDWLSENWFLSPNYITLRNRPLLLNFGPIYVKDATVWKSAFSSIPKRPMFFALHHLWKDVNADGGFTWVHASAWEGGKSKAELRKALYQSHSSISKRPRQIIASAIPGFRDVYEKSYQSIDHRNGETFEDSLAVAMSGDWPIVQLVTWNDYGEGTMIEPTHEFGYRFLETVQKARRYELGSEFEFQSEDLLLPAKLFSLRKSSQEDKDDLNRVAAMLLKGETKQADRLLNTHYTKN